MAPSSQCCAANGRLRDSYAGALESAGFSEDSTFTSDGTVNNVYSNDEWTVGLSYFGDQSDDQLDISVFTKN